MRIPVLLAIQTTAESIDDGTLDAVTLVLVVAFAVSMVALSVMLTRRPQEPPDQTPSRQPVDDAPRINQTLTVDPPIDVRPSSPRGVTVPAWRTGVTLPRETSHLAEATGVVEQVLAARHTRNLAAGLPFFTETYLEQLAIEFGVPTSDLCRVLDAATYSGDAPALRSVELISAKADQMSVRAGYVDRTSEIYRLVRIDGRWAIDAIERG